MYKKTSQNLPLFKQISFSLFLITLFILSSLMGCATSVVNKVSGRHNSPETLKKPYVLLISIDGYRWDYTDLLNPPVLTQFRDSGASAKYMLPVYPSKTFTNHYSLVTGLYAENHGIVANTFFDPSKNKIFKLSNRKEVSDGSWYYGVPLWVAAEKQNMISATYFWPASEASILNVRPTYYVNYDSKITHEQRIDQIVQWLKLPESERPHLLTLYFSDVDTAGHKFGPNSPEVKEAVMKVDQTLGKLFKKLEAENLDPNIVVVSDHGMQQMDPEKMEYLEDYADFNGIQVLGAGPQALVYTKSKKQTSEILSRLKKGKHFKAYSRVTMPAAWHYSQNPKVGEIVVAAEAPWGVMLKKGIEKFENGTHGFNPDKTSTMRAVFYAKGPDIQKKGVIAPFRNIHVYPFLL